MFLFPFTGHLIVGEASVLDRLRKKGYTVHHVGVSENIEGYVYVCVCLCVCVCVCVNSCNGHLGVPATPQMPREISFKYRPKYISS